MGVLEFAVIWHMSHGYLWRPLNDLAKKICELANRKNLTKQQVEMCRDIGFDIKETMVTI